MIVLPVLVIGGGLTSLETVAGAAVLLTPLTLIVLLLTYASRPWSGAPVVDEQSAA